MNWWRAQIEYNGVMLLHLNVATLDVMLKAVADTLSGLPQSKPGDRIRIEMSPL